MEKVSLKDVGGLLRSQLGGSLMVPSSHYPLLPLPTIPSLGTQLSGRGGGEREGGRGREKRGETGERGKKCHYPLLPLPTIPSLGTQLSETLLAHHHLIPFLGLDDDQKYALINIDILKYPKQPLSLVTPCYPSPPSQS